MLRGSALYTPEHTVFLLFTEELRELYTQTPSDAEFGKLVQNLTTIQLSCDWKADQERNFPTDLLLTLTTELAAYDAHNGKVAENRTADGVSQAMLVKKIADLELALQAKADDDTSLGWMWSGVRFPTRPVPEVVDMV